METTDTLTALMATLEKYRKNKTLVPPDQLAGKYKIPFEKLKTQLKEEAGEYLKAYSLEGLQVKKEDSEYYREFAEVVNQIFSDRSIMKQAGTALFKNFSMEEFKQLSEQLRSRVYTEAYTPYFQNYTCLYATEACFNEDNPQSPRIYNSLVDKFWDERTGKWISDKEAGAPVAMIYYQRERKQHEQE